MRHLRPAALAALALLAACADPKDADSTWQLLNVYRGDVPMRLDEFLGLIRFKEGFPKHRAVTDGSFGKLVAFGLGGVLVEVLKDITFRLAPATKSDALSMLDGIQAAEMLKGVRGGDAVNRDALANLIVGVSELVSDFPEISEMDLNPVFASKTGAIAADTTTASAPATFAAAWPIATATPSLSRRAVAALAPRSDPET
jgi:acyl-CoA synthetase (NDP forming)